MQSDFSSPLINVPLSFPLTQILLHFSSLQSDFIFHSLQSGFISPHSNLDSFPLTLILLYFASPHPNLASFPLIPIWLHFPLPKSGFSSSPFCSTYEYLTISLWTTRLLTQWSVFCGELFALCIGLFALCIHFWNEPTIDEWYSTLPQILWTSLHRFLNSKFVGFFS